MKLCEMTALELASAIRSSEISSLEAVSYFIDRIIKYDGRLRSFITVCRDQALARAKEIDAMISRGEICSSLMGVPIALKDNIITENIKTTAGSKLLKDYLPVYSATAAERISAAGLIIIGKTNMDEFAMGASTEKSAFAVASNPHNTDMVTGGSSGGSAAAVSAGLVPIALGSDTGGSIRQPASYCGVTGYKPSYGTVSRFGLIAFASSLDQIGVIGKNAADCRALADIICGSDGKDMTVRDFQLDGNFSVKGKKIGIPEQFLSDKVSSPIKEAFLNSMARLEESGAELEFFDMPLLKYSVPVYHIISAAEASSNLARFDGVRYGSRAREYENTEELYKKSRTEGFGIEVKRRIMTGTFVLSKGFYDDYFKRAVRCRDMLCRSFDRAFERYDLIAGLTAPDTAFKKGINDDTPLKMYLLDEFTASVNLAGLPAASLPCGYDGSGLPIGLQIIGNRFSDGRMLSAAEEIQLLLGRERSDVPPGFKEEI